MKVHPQKVILLCSGLMEPLEPYENILSFSLLTSFIFNSSQLILSIYSKDKLLSALHSFIHLRTHYTFKKQILHARCHAACDRNIKMTKTWSQLTNTNLGRGKTCATTEGSLHEVPWEMNKKVGV